MNNSSSKQLFARRIAMSAAGVMISAVCVGAFKLAAMGVDPFQSLMSGLDACVPIPFGTLYVIVNAVMLLFALAFDRHYIGAATFINLFLLGYVVEFSYAALQAAFPAPGMITRAVSFILGFVFLCLGSSLYITADMGVSTYDAVALIMSGTWKLGKFKYIRIATDLVCIALGVGLYLLGGGAPGGIAAFVGLGTILTAFFMGPLIDLFNRAVAVPLLRGKGEW
ncbi:MAG: hypothetical protein J6K32_12245 [Clostridia bacterium]|nr:hypothetical protein [Clostridia bacterium]